MERGFRTIALGRFRTLFEDEHEDDDENDSERISVSSLNHLSMNQ